LIYPFAFAEGIELPVSDEPGVTELAPEKAGLADRSDDLYLQGSFL
jgi:hypothetical protein